MAWRLTEAEKLINELQLTRRESEAFEASLGFLQDENARLRKALRAAYEILGECLKDGEE